MSPQRKKDISLNLSNDLLETNKVKDKVPENKSTLTLFEFPSLEVRRSLGANADFSIEWIEIKRNINYVRGIRIGYSNGLISELMGGKNAEKCQGTVIKGLGTSPVKRLSIKVVDNVSRHPSYAGIEFM